MFDYEPTLSSIEAKLRQIESQAASYSTDNGLCNRLQQTINEQQTIINELNEQINLLKTGNKPTLKDKTADITLRIDQILQTIDTALGSPA